MIDISAVFAEFNGSFPNFVGKNATGAGATDGTEYIAAMIDNWAWGWQQALFDYEGFTPDGVTESAGASQIVDAMNNMIPPGMVAEWNINVDPATLGARYLLLNGQGILRANYPLLDANVYVGDGNNAAVAAAGGAYYRADDAAGTTPNIAGAYLILPESRGYTTRGLDSAASVDPDGASRYLGDNQIDAMQTTRGSFRLRGFELGSDLLDNPLGSFTIAVGGASALTAASSGNSVARDTVNFDNTNSTSPNAAKTDDDESRMSNRSTQFAIRY